MILTEKRSNMVLGIFFETKTIIIAQSSDDTTLDKDWRWLFNKLVAHQINIDEKCQILGNMYHQQHNWHHFPHKREKG